MGGMKGSALSAALIVGAVTFTWSALLDERARTSVKRAAMSTVSLLDHLMGLYMSDGREQSPIDDEQNRLWVQQQWKDIGY